MWGVASLTIALILFQSFSAHWSEAPEWRGALFRLREWSGQEPPLADNLVVYVLGDTSVAALHSTDLSLSEWAGLFRSLERHGARDVLVDKIFSFDSAPQPVTDFVREMKKVKRPPVTGAFLSDREIPARPMIPTDHRALALGRSYRPEAGFSVQPIYGAASSLSESLYRPGLLNYKAGTVPLMVLKGPVSGIPFAAALLAESRLFDGDGLRLNGMRVPEISPGRVLVNFLSPHQLKDKKYSLQSLRESLAQGKPPTALKPGSTVVILTAYYAGGTQPIETPFGEFPSGFAQVALANSVLTGSWIKPFEYPRVMVAGVVALGVVAATATSLAYSLGVATVFCLGLGLATALLFVAGSILFPLSLGLISFGIAFGPLYFRRLLRQRREYRLIIDSLQGVIPQRHLQAVVRNGARQLREPQSYHLSILFLDIVGFSELAEKTSPKETFALLKERLTDVTQLVHKYGGIVDKTLGDGLLCFFGLSADGTLQPDHADRAVRCAIAIQQQSIENCLADPGDSPVVPFRIGINSGSCLLGDLGGQSRIDLTVVGANVNMAKRYETAAEPFGIVIGETTRQQLTAEDLIAEQTHSRWYPIKNHPDPVKAYVFESESKRSDTEAALANYRRFRGLKRMEERKALTRTLRVDCGWFGEGEVLNYSAHGLCISLPRYLGTGINLKCELLLSEDERAIILGEVRWGSVGPNGTFLHGLKIVGLADLEKLELFEKMRKAREIPNPKSKRRSSKRAA